MPKLKLSKFVVEKLSTEGRENIFWDDALHGFGVRVKPNGTKSYIVQYRNRTTGRSRRQTIGPVGPLLSFANARKEAMRLLSEAVQGRDPVETRQTARKAETIADLAEQYLTHHAMPKKREKSVANDVSMLNAIIIPELGDRKVAEVGHRDIQALHNSLRETPYRANRTLALLSKMFALSVRWGWRPDNPAKGVERFREQKRYRWLSDAELARLVAVLDEHPNQKAANAVRLQLLTGARIGEVLQAEWKDFDLVRGVWVKPSHHTKQKRTEHLPLSNAAVTLLQAIHESADPSDRFVFPGKLPGQPLKELKRFWQGVTASAELSDYRIHDNRHTHASHLVSSGLSLPIVGRLLGHTNPLTTQRYAHLADDPLRAAAEIMAQKLER
ncbi:tyrosine-type recombinase/integrase [Marivivens marinus]|uniref:tyrosine-type recombinase/integrase n=1 Tax=Marivivens marinus TaxID=3110173 RepID=UPI003B846E74